MYHNQRFPEMWKIITEHIDFRDKRVLDLGCGYGDFAKAAYSTGAIVYGIDNDDKILNQLRNNNIEKVRTGRFNVIYDDINKWDKDFTPFRQINPTHKKKDIDILTCFSVLPYLDNMEEKLELFSLIADTVILEVQYLGDGPGTVANDLEMEKILFKFYSKVQKIGHTTVDYRKTQRSIWLCSV